MNPNSRSRVLGASATTTDTAEPAPPSLTDPGRADRSATHQRYFFLAQFRLELFRDLTMILDFQPGEWKNHLTWYSGVRRGNNALCNPNCPNGIKGTGEIPDFLLSIPSTEKRLIGPGLTVGGLTPTCPPCSTSGVEEIGLGQETLPEKTFRVRGLT